MKWYVLVIITTGLLLLSGCGSRPARQETQPTNPAQVQEATQAEGTNPADNLPDDPSLVIFRQAMVETPQLFAAAFFGYAPQGTAEKADPFPVMQEAAPQLCEDLPFLLTIHPERILGTEGQLFCIVPADEHATVAVNRVKWNAETESYEYVDVIYRRESGDPILLMCNGSKNEPDTEIVITDSNGNVARWQPHMDSSYCVAPLYNDSAESLLLDFTDYETLPNPGWNYEIDSSGLVGTWEQVWSEVEGDRNEAEPGACVIEIAQDDAGGLLFTYSDRNYLDGNVEDRELLVQPGELYPDCGNGQWFGDVMEIRGDTTSYALTLLEDGSLLVRIGFDVDGQPMISHLGFVRK